MREFLKNVANRIFGVAPAAPESEPAASAPEEKPQSAPEPVIRRAAVIGAGVMGSGIAAQLANAGIEVLLLDKFPGAAQKAIERMLKATPATDPMSAGFMHRDHAKRISVGTTDDDMARIADADWIIEVVPEILPLKHATFKAIDQHRKPGSVVSSNTSTIPLSTLSEGMSDTFKQDFLITHFFNPVRFMDLLEIVTGPATRPEVTAIIQKVCDTDLGKKVVLAQDTPGFIGNRIGTYMIQRAMAETVDKNLKIEEVDAALGVGVGFPKDGIFGLMDIIGLDLGPKVTQSLQNSLSPDDAFQNLTRCVPVLDQLIAEGKTGRKSKTKEGFYRMVTGADGTKTRQVIDLDSGTYRDAVKISFDSMKLGRKSLRPVLEHGDAGSQIAWNVLRDTLAYTAGLTGALGGDINAIDTAMRAGYNWKYGPFEMIDRMGTAWFAERLEEAGMEPPKILQVAHGRPLYAMEGNDRVKMTLSGQYMPMIKPDGILDLADIKRAGHPVSSNNSASLWDLGDGVLCAELHGMKSALDPDTISMLGEAVETVSGSGGKFKALVIYSDDKNFAVGANLGLAARVMNMGNWDLLDDIVGEGQQAMQRLKFAPFPVVGAVGGLALGGGCEILLHCDALQAHAESYIGLVETGVGLVPAWGGCKEYLLRAQDAYGDKGPMLAIRKTFETIMLPNLSTSTSAHTAKTNLFLREGDGISMNRDRLLADAKAKALGMVADYTPPAPRTLTLPGPEGKTALRMALDDLYAKGDATWHDIRVAEMLTTILTGGDKTNHLKAVSETDIMLLERQAFVTLAKTAQTRARIRHTVNTGKPLREGPLAMPLQTTALRSMLDIYTPKERTIETESSAPVESAPSSGTGPLPDTTGMKPMDAVITIMKKDGWMPAPPPLIDSLLSIAFNESAQQTKQGTIDFMNKKKGMAGFLPAERVRSEILGGFDKNIQKAGNQLLAATDEQQKIRLQASQKVMEHYRDVVRELKF